MQHGKARLRDFIISIATSGRYSTKKESGTSDYLIRYVLMNFICIVGSLILMGFIIYNLRRRYYNVTDCAIMVIILLISFLLARTKIRQFIPALLIMISYGLLCAYITWIKQSQGANFLFIYLYPLITIMLLGMRWGIILSSALFLIVGAEMFVPWMSNYSYHIKVSARMAVTYSLVFSIMIIIEFTRKIKDRQIEIQKQELENFNNNLQDMVKEKTKDVLDLQNALLKTMAEMVEYRDHITGSHIERTQSGVRILLDEMKKEGIYKEEIKNWNIDLLLQSCQLHDVGKISVSDNILKKPAKLTEMEFEEMKKHTLFGEQIIKKIQLLTRESDFLKYAAIFASSHHEKWDGSGYPYGLSQNEIPLLGRIMAIADVYDALTSSRPYKKVFSHEEAIQIIIKDNKIQFDPVLVNVFIVTAEQFRDLSRM